MEEFLASLTPEEMSYIVEGIGWGGNNTPIIGAQSNSVKVLLVKLPVTIMKQEQYLILF